VNYQRDKLKGFTELIIFRDPTNQNHLSYYQMSYHAK